METLRRAEQLRNDFRCRYEEWEWGKANSEELFIK